MIQFGSHFELAWNYQLIRTHSDGCNFELLVEVRRGAPKFFAPPTFRHKVFSPNYQTTQLSHTQTHNTWKSRIEPASKTKIQCSLPTSLNHLSDLHPFVSFKSRGLCWPISLDIWQSIKVVFGSIDSAFLKSICGSGRKLFSMCQFLWHIHHRCWFCGTTPYFERLWCNYELAVHVKAAASKDAPALQLVPMWMPIWTLSSCGLFTIAGFLFAEQGSTTESVDLDSKTAVSLFMSIYNRHFNIPICLYLAVSVVFSWFCFGKVRRHKKMLDQMTNFDLRNARWAPPPNCWWETSCTSWDEKHPINNEINYMSAGAGFRLSTLCFFSQAFSSETSQPNCCHLRPFFAYPLTKRDDHEPRGSSSQWTGKQCRNIFQRDKIHLVLVMTMCHPPTHPPIKTYWPPMIHWWLAGWLSLFSVDLNGWCFLS